MEKIKKFLDSIGVSQDIQTNLFSEESPEDFTIESAANSFIQKRRELTLNDSDVLSGLKKRFNNEQYPAIIKPIIKRMQSLGGLTPEDLASLTPDGQKLPDLKALIDLTENKFKQSAAGSVDEQKEKYFALQNEFNLAKESHQAAIEKMQSDFAEEKRMTRVKSHFVKAVNGLDLVLPSDAANTLLQTSLFGKYRFDVNDKNELTVLTQDGTKVADDRDFISASELIKRTADEFKILKKSNGGNGGEGRSHPPADRGQGNPPWNERKLSNRAAEMQRKIEEQNRR